MSQTNIFLHCTITGIIVLISVQYKHTAVSLESLSQSLSQTNTFLHCSITGITVPITVPNKHILTLQYHWNHSPNHYPKQTYSDTAVSLESLSQTNIFLHCSINGITGPITLPSKHILTLLNHWNHCPNHCPKQTYSYTAVSLDSLSKSLSQTNILLHCSITRFTVQITVPNKHVLTLQYNWNHCPIQTYSYTAVSLESLSQSLSQTNIFLHCTFTGITVLITVPYKHTAVSLQLLSKSLSQTNTFLHCSITGITVPITVPNKHILTLQYHWNHCPKQTCSYTAVSLESLSQSLSHTNIFFHCNITGITGPITVTYKHILTLQYHWNHCPKQTYSYTAVSLVSLSHTNIFLHCTITGISVPIIVPNKHILTLQYNWNHCPNHYPKQTYSYTAVSLESLFQTNIFLHCSITGITVPNKQILTLQYYWNHCPNHCPIQSYSYTAVSLELLSQ